MKKFSFLLALLLITLALAGSAMAESQLDFELKCKKKTSYAADVYDYNNPDSGVKVDHIAAGTYVIVENGDGGWTRITYMKNGARKKGAVQVRLSDTRSTVRLDDGTILNVHEKDPNYAGKIKKGNLEFDVTVYDDEMDYMTYMFGEGPEPRRADGSNGREKERSGNSGKKRSPSKSGGMSVEVVELGSAFTTIKKNGETVTVPTGSLNYGEDVPTDKKLAVIYAPRTGTVGLHRGASKESRTIKICKPGVMVMVLKADEPYSKVNYQGTVGYVKNTSLQFFGAAAQDAFFSSGLISSKGKTTGKTTIRIRNTADQASAVVANWQVGTPVTVLSNPKGWYEIEAKGIRGFVKEEFLTMNE
ncbi:MAG: SH3 domain-containing protein [Clostridia bacterium]|nr:SH3 domain-containing protein [Clostridia bacterium]